MDVKEMIELKVRISSIFRPGTPIDKQALFSGRISQVKDVFNATLQPGCHVVLFGERGVGKTSLARVIFDILSSGGFKGMDCGTINCDPTDDFSSLWRKVFRELSFSAQVHQPGFQGADSTRTTTLEDLLPSRPLNPDDIRYMLTKMGRSMIIVIDELDRLTDRQARTGLADTLKTLSDHAVATTIILVGVADSVEELIAQHHSIERALVQVPMPRMSSEELVQILDNGLSTAEMTTEEGVKEWITSLSQGLPHYTHSLGLYSAFSAIDDQRTEITAEDVLEATRTAVLKSHTIRSAYNKATSSPHKQNLYSRVLLACALADTDELGFFTASSVSGPMSAIMRKAYDVPNFSRHLYDFCDAKRGPILKKIGQPRRIRFRFIEPMMQPFVIIHDYSVGLLTNELLKKTKGRGRNSADSPARPVA